MELLVWGRGPCIISEYMASSKTELVLLGGCVQTIQVTARLVRKLNRGNKILVRTRLDTLPDIGEEFTLVGPRAQATGKISGFHWEESTGRITLQISPFVFPPFV
jgi:hypothetical protein